MVSVTVKVDAALLSELDSLAQKKELTRSAAIRQALEEYTTGVQGQYLGIPPEVKDRVAFMMLLLMDGTPDQDWELVREEVLGLWTIVQS